MKSSFKNRFLNPTSSALAFAMLAFCLPAAAQTGTWSDIGFGPSNWSNSARWTGTTVANGASNSATFGSNITQATVVTVDSTRTIGNITFSDNAAGGSPWILRGTSTLTMDNGASQAVITKTTTTTISTPISGSNIRISGGAGMNLLGNNAGITGTLALNGINGVAIGNANAFGSAAVNLTAAEVVGGTTRGIAIANNFTFNNTYYQNGFGLTLNGTLNLSGGGQGFQTWAAITDAVQAGAVNLGSNNLNVSGGAVGGLRISGNISGTGGIAKSGSSTLTLSGANSYIGATAVTAGRINFNSTTNTSDLTVSNAGTILGGEGASSNAISVGAGGIIAFDPSTTAAIATTSALSIPGAVTLSIEPSQAMAIGTNVVDVVKYGTFTATELANITLPTGIRSGVLTDDTVNSKITLTLQTGTRTWEGTASFPDWDSLSTDSWVEGDKKFGVADSVVFNDTAAAGGTVYVVGKLTPATVTFDHSTLDYTLEPASSTVGQDQIIGGTSLVKNGTGVLTINNTNAYNGGTSLNAGTLAFVNGALGTYGDITMNGGTLKWQGTNTQDISRRLFLVDGKAAILDTGSNNVSFNTSLGGSTATTASIVKNGTGTLTLNNSFSPGAFSGGTTVNGGTLSLGTGGTGNFTGSPAALGTGLVTINTGARVRLWIQNSHTHEIANNFLIDGGRLHDEDGIYNINGTVSVAAGGATFSAVWGGKNLNLNGVISGEGPVTVEPNSAQIRFLNNNTHSGTVALSNGSLLLNNTQVSSTYTLASGSTLVLRSATVAGNITGPGAVTKDISTFGDSTINGTSNDYTGATTINISRFTVGATGVINGTSSITIQGQWEANFNNLGSVTTPGNISVAGSGNLTGGGVTTYSSIFRNSGTVSAASILLNSSASTNTIANRGGTYTQTAGATTASVAITLSPNGGTGAAGTAGNDTTLNLDGGTLASPTIALNSGTLNATAGTLTLGAGGLSSAGTNTIAVNLGATTLAASAAWSSSVAATLTDSTTGTTVDTTGGNIALSGVLSGSGNLIKTGSGTLTLSGTNTYTGTTNVDLGVLAVDGDSLEDSSVLNIDGGVVAPSGGTEVVSQLFFGATQQAAGTWGASGSGATHVDNTRFTGTGVVSVTTGPATGYSTWASTNAGGQESSLDFDNDGVSNGVEYFMNASTGFTANPTLNGANTITWVNGGNISESAYGTEFVVQTSSNLTTWTDVPLANVTSTAGSLSYTLSGPGPKFVRLLVAPN